MSGLQELDAKALHEIMQPLNIIRLSCGNIRRHILLLLAAQTDVC